MTMDPKALEAMWRAMYADGEFIDLDAPDLPAYLRAGHLAKLGGYVDVYLAALPPIEGGELVERLRVQSMQLCGGECQEAQTMLEAAETIIRLTRERDEAREELASWMSQSIEQMVDIGADVDELKETLQELREARVDATLPESES